MVFKIYRAGDLHNKPGKPGIFNVGRTHFYDAIEPRLEKARLGRRLEAPSFAALLADVSVDSVPLLKLMYIFGSLGVGPKHP
jgi:hypothetical protein